MYASEAGIAALQITVASRLRNDRSERERVELKRTVGFVSPSPCKRNQFREKGNDHHCNNNKKEDKRQKENEKRSDFSSAMLPFQSPTETRNLSGTLKNT